MAVSAAAETELPRRDMALSLLSVVIFSSGNVAVKFVVGEIPPLTGVAVRFTLAAVLFAPLVRWPGWRQIAVLTQIAVCLSVVHQGLIFWSLTRIDAALSIILIQSQVVFTTLLGWLFLGEHVGWRSFLGIALGMGGVVVLVGLPAHPPDIMGVLGMLAAALFVSVAFLRMKHLTAMTAATYISLLHVIAAPLAWALAFALERPTAVGPLAAVDPRAGLALIYLAVVLSTAHLIWQRLMNRNPISKIVPFSLLMPFTGVALAVTVLDETISIDSAIGSLLTIAGVAIIILRRARPDRTPPTR